MTPDQIVQAMVANTTITKSAGRGEATIMTISYDGETGPKAALFSLAQRFRKATVRSRARSAAAAT